jgi:hypothetical protein
MSETITTLPSTHLRSQPARRGFALPMAILLLLVMTAAVTASFSRVGAEIRLVDNQRAETAAYALAEAGLQRYLARGRITPADTTMVLPGGTARVRITLVRSAPTSVDTPLYVIRSDGVVAGATRIPQGRRTVAQYGFWVRSRIQVPAMWNSLSGLHKDGISGRISGADLCSSDSLAGVAVPDSGYSYSYVGNLTSPLLGSPGLRSMGTADEFGNELKVDWAGMMNPQLPAGRADVIVCFPGTAGYDSRWGPCTQWPASAAWTTNPDYWPAILVNGSATLPSSGRGMLMVTGNLRLTGGQTWDGLVLVGHQLTDNGAGRVTGAVVSGLNLMNGETGLSPSQAEGTKDYLYDSCAIKQAANTQSQWLHMTNAWVDNWTSW